MRCEREEGIDGLDLSARGAWISITWSAARPHFDLVFALVEVKLDDEGGGTVSGFCIVRMKVSVIVMSGYKQA